MNGLMLCMFNLGYFVINFYFWRNFKIYFNVWFYKEYKFCENV